MTAVDGDQTAGDTYDARAVQEKWQARWAEQNPFAASEDPADDRPRRYVVDMFAYPSGDLHMGHAEAFAIGDVIARYAFQRGENVLHPIGWDSFGLPAENAAIKHNTHPAEWTYANIETQAESFRRYGIAVDWSRRLHTSDPEYYKWNQWLFLRFFERGLAYRKDGLVNWCPKDQTVLANEQVVQGRCERCGTEVVRRSLNQWYYRITAYADRLLDDMDQLENGNWPDDVLTMQRNWIGRSHGADVRFAIEGREEPVSVFTTRPDTLYGATFFVVAADAPLADELCADDHRAEFEAYREQVAKLSDIERQSTERPKTGVFLGRYAINPVNGERIPVWAADYVLADYGHGAIMAVPAHDQRDLDFALKFGLKVREVVDTGEPSPAESGVATAGEGRLMNSGPLDGLSKSEAIPRIIEILGERGTGSAAVNYRLRDWLLSRQRFWGTPIPIVHCPDCGEVPVPDDQLPVKLPDNLKGADLAPKGVSPLAAAADWVNTECPKCGGAAKRDTDTMDTFVDSSWYFLRYCSPGDDSAPFDIDKVAKWGPVDQYIGGKEHATLHLMYARFFVKVLYDMGMVGFTEPFRRLLNQGQVINQGKAMSKSLGNGVDLGEEIDKYGVDAVRLTMIFAGPPEDDIDWADVSPAASLKFLNRAYRVMAEAGAASAPGADPASGDLALRKATHQALDKITAAVDAQRFNVAVARIMELVTAARKAIDSGPGAADPAVREAAEVVAITLALFAPYVAEEGWERLGHTGSVSVGNWRRPDPALLTQESVTCVVQVASKVRDKLEVAPDVSAEELERLALASEKVQAFIDGREVRRIVVRAPKLVNIVVG
ncbi:leucine--tRNA ligase [Streptomonospora nanhaiensis]|uniref:Leucine--tRNA ligase n=1 Tax=Streptomonospora nanhaiensis TaxID=1323731 RepID=A0A853BUC0_9ACTN|nr:leucine--tRNA ligase [Streptomonospora nanhaiensis]MBV2363565.1 leucine--tRNA ligase [Streptomonospora nanhaiensis]MBX9390249.1 leucine--tRNA ligase [Streptomonospora nanhaiensis]NYI98580.1 leucyl-tRNA synthetase [Streptomonospora nanhaiensis]